MQSVEGGQNGSDVLPLTRSSQKASCRILNHLEACNGRLAYSIIKCVAVIQPRRDEGMEYCLQVLLSKKCLPLCPLPQVEEAGLKHDADLFTSLKLLSILKLK